MAKLALIWSLAAYAMVGMGQFALADYILARAPQSSATNLAAAWKPFLDRLSSEVGAKITLRLYPNRKAFEDELYKGTPDFAFMNPYYAVSVRKSFGYNALVRDDGQRLKGIILVPMESPIKTVQDLQGKTIAFADVNAMGASLLPRAILTREHGLSFKPIYVGPHENVYRATFAGQVDAGAGVPQTFSDEPEDLRRQLRVVFETPSVPSHPLIAHPRVPAELQTKITQAVLRFRDDENGRSLLKAVRMANPTAVNFDADYGVLSELHLEEFVDVTAE